MVPYRYMALGIILFVAATTYLSSVLLPPVFSEFAGIFLLLKLTVLLIWLWSSHRVRRRRENIVAKKTAKGRLWDGPISPEAVQIPKQALELIRYRFDKDEKISLIARQHPIAKTVCYVHAAMAVVCVLLTLTLAAVYPAVDETIQPVFGPAQGPGPEDASHIYFTIWWIPSLFTLFFVYEALEEWQNWKWTIRIIGDKHLMLLREQSTYMPWTGKNWEVYPVHQIIGVDTEAGSVSGTVGYGTVTLTIRKHEHGEEKEIEIELVENEDEFEEEIRKVAPAFRGQQHLELVTEPREVSEEQTVEVDLEDLDDHEEQTAELDLEEPNGRAAQQ